jgi:hypothetical protein
VCYQRYQDDMNERHVEDFTIPIPPPFPPHFGPPGRGRMLFIREDDEQSDTGREHEDIMLRKVPRETAMRFRAGAGGRGLTHAQHLAALVELHARVRALADAGDERLRAELDGLGLQTVTV